MRFVNHIYTVQVENNPWFYFCFKWSERSRAYTYTDRHQSRNSSNSSTQTSANLKNFSAFKARSFSSSFQQPRLANSMASQRHHSTDIDPCSIYQRNKKKRLVQVQVQEGMDATSLEAEDVENWRLTLSEALNNTLLMFFAGYETTSSAISFCFKIISSMPGERDKVK